jgi:HlyD family secretion protein
MWVRIYVPEPKVGLVHVGQTATFTVDTFPNRTFKGKVVDVSNQAEYTPRNVQTLDQRSEQVFGVKVEIEPTPELKPGMAALLRIAS